MATSFITDCYSDPVVCISFEFEWKKNWKKWEIRGRKLKILKSSKKKLEKSKEELKKLKKKKEINFELSFSYDMNKDDHASAGELPGWKTYCANEWWVSIDHASNTS